MDQQTGQHLLDEWAAQQTNETTMAIERGFVQPGRSFSREAVEELAFAITLFIQARLIHRWEKTNEPPTAATVHIKVNPQ
jgi:hypothetical protein